MSLVINIALMKPAWKVVRWQDKNAYGSATLVGRILLYGFNHITEPHAGDGPLAVFASKKSAHKFARRLGQLAGDENSGHRRTLPCRYKPSKYKSVWTDDSPYKPLRSLPKGTILADAVILMKE